MLVSVPVDLWGTVRVTLTREPMLSVTPSLPKARAAIRRREVSLDSRSFSRTGTASRARR